jgi:hypothetical protein
MLFIFHIFVRIFFTICILFSYTFAASFEDFAKVIHANNNGNLGIGTTTPLDKLTVTDGNIGIRNKGGNSSLFNTIGFGTMKFRAPNNVNHSATISMEGGYGFSGGGSLHFATGSDGNPKKRMTIVQNGNVGIGVIKPATKLQVDSNEPQQTYFIPGSKGLVVGSSKNLTEGLALWHRGNGDDFIGSLYNHPQSALHFVNRASSSSKSIITMTLKNGRVGIGTDKPSEKLEVKGNIKISGNIVSSFGNIITTSESGDICIGNCK